MSISNFTRLADAKPNFQIEKFEMPRNSFRLTVNPINPIINSADVIEIASSIVPPIQSAAAVLKPPRFSPGKIATGIVVGSIVLIALTTIIINRNSKN